MGFSLFLQAAGLSDLAHAQQPGANIISRNPERPNAWGDTEVAIIAARSRNKVHCDAIRA